MSGGSRGILRPEAIGHAFSLERLDAPADLTAAIDGHWIVRWDLRGRDPYRSEVLTHPAVHIVFEPHGAFVYGVRRSLDVRILSGAGFAVGTKFRPGGFAAFTERPLSDLTDSVVPLGEVFGDAGAEFAASARTFATARAALDPLLELLRGRSGERGVEAALVDDIVADMRVASPGTRVAEIAARHAVSVRTLQRLFSSHVGVSPKWVLQRYRLHEALEQVAGSGDIDWTRLALDLGYFDHAHFIRDFRAVAGRTPAQYEREALARAA